MWVCPDLFSSSLSVGNASCCQLFFRCLSLMFWFFACQATTYISLPSPAPSVRSPFYFFFLLIFNSFSWVLSPTPIDTLIKVSTPHLCTSNHSCHIPLKYLTPHRDQAVSQPSAIDCTCKRALCVSLPINVLLCVSEHVCARVDNLYVDDSVYMHTCVCIYLWVSCVWSEGRCVQVVTGPYWKHWNSLSYKACSSVL